VGNPCDARPGEISGARKHFVNHTKLPQRPNTSSEDPSDYLRFTPTEPYQLELRGFASIELASRGSAKMLPQLGRGALTARTAGKYM
jgi:hypothetical protein